MSPRELLARLEAIRRDPVEFLRAVRTLDETDKRNPVKHFPADLEYVRIYCNYWLVEPFIAVPKSRRMKMTWTNVALYLWDTLFFRGRANGFISKKEDDSDKLVKRAEFIYDNLDEKILPRAIVPEKNSKYGLLEFPEIKSLIRGYASSSDGPRQDTLSGALCDEMAFWPNAQALYTSLVPTLEGGGRLTAISSRSPGFFQALVYDRLDTYATDGAS